MDGNCVSPCSKQVTLSLAYTPGLRALVGGLERLDVDCGRGGIVVGEEAAVAEDGETGVAQMMCA